MVENNDSDFDRFIDMAEKYAALTEVTESLMKNRQKLIQVMAEIWPDLSNNQKDKVNKFLVQLHKDSMLQLSTEPVFSAHFKSLIQKTSKQRNQL